MRSVNAIRKNDKANFFGFIPFEIKKMCSTIKIDINAATVEKMIKAKYIINSQKSISK
jgi:hypothetical protein